MLTNKNMLTNKKPWNRRAGQIFFGYAFLEVFFTTFITHYGFLSIFLTLLGMTVDVVFMQVWVIGMWIYVIGYVLFGQIKGMKRIDYAKDQLLAGEPLLKTLQESVTWREWVIGGCVVLLLAMVTLYYLIR